MKHYAKRLDELTRRVVDAAATATVCGPINSISGREAMGLGPKLVDYYSETFADIQRLLWGKPVSELQKIARSAHAHVVERLCAANALNLAGPDGIDDLPEFVEIPAGRFFQGTEVDAIDGLWQEFSHLGVQRSWIEKEAPRHSVGVDRFFLSKFPITNRQYRRYLVESSSGGLPSSWQFGAFPAPLANHPVYTISLEDIDSYCRWLGARTRREVRLPTESEWEYAAGNGNSWQYTWGDEFLPFRSNTNEILLQSSSPVGVFLEGCNRWGVADLVGNVEEFVQDSYAPYPGAPLVQDDLYKKLGRYRIAKGGAFNRFRDLARVQRRHGAYPSSLYAIGFRVACT